MKLKPCPHCNGEVTLGFFREDYSFHCDFCNAFTRIMRDKETAIQIWNTRPLEDALKAHAVEVLSGVLRLLFITEARLRGTSTDYTDESIEREAKQRLGYYD